MTKYKISDWLLSGFVLLLLPIIIIVYTLGYFINCRDEEKLAKYERIWIH